MITKFQETALKVQFIKRYHMRDTSRQQNVAEHSYGVAMLAMETALWVTWLNTDKGEGFVYRVLMQALLHDLPECFTGDLDYWVKKSPSIRETWDKFERGCILDFTNDLPTFLIADVRQSLLPPKGSSALEYCIVKQADYLELVNFCYDDYLRGNKKSLQMAALGLRAFNRYTHPTLDDDECPAKILWKSLNNKVSSNIPLNTRIEQ